MSNGTSIEHVSPSQESKEINALLQKISGLLSTLEENVSRNVELSSVQQANVSSFIAHLDEWGENVLDTQTQQSLREITAQWSSQSVFFLDKHQVDILQQATQRLLEAKIAETDQEQHTLMEPVLAQVDSSLEALVSEVKEKNESVGSNSETPQEIEKKPGDAGFVPRTKKEALQDLHMRKKRLSQKAISTFMQKLRSSWVGRTLDWFGLDEYLDDKFVQGKEIGTVRNALWGGVLFFYGKELYASMAKVGSLQPNLSGVADAAQDLLDQKDKATISPEEQEKIEQEQEKYNLLMMDSYKKKIEAMRGSSLSPQEEKKFAKIYTQWAADNKDILHDSYINWKQKQKASQEGKEYFYYVDNVLHMATIPARSFLQLMQRCKENQLIHESQFVLTTVIERGKAYAQFAIQGTTMLGSALHTLTGKIPFDEALGALNEHVQDMDHEQRLAWLGMMYRYGGGVSKIASALGKANGVLLSKLLGGAVDTEQMKMMFKGGIMGDIQEHVRMLQEFEEVMDQTGVFQGAHSKPSEFCKKLTKNMEFAAWSTHFADQYAHETVDNFNKFCDAMKQQGFSEQIDAWKQRLTNEGAVLDGVSTNKTFKFKKLLGQHIQHTVQQQKAVLQKGFVGECFASVKNGFSYSREHFRRTMMQQYDAIVDTYAHGLQNYGSITRAYSKKIPLVGRFASIPNNVKQAAALAEGLEESHRMKFYLKSPKDAKEFFSYCESLAQKSPQVLASIMGNAPLILVGGQVMQELATNSDSSVVGSTAYAIANLMPVVGPMLFIRDSLKSKGTEGIDWQGAGVGAMLAGYDGFVYARKGGSLPGFFKEVAKASLDPFKNIAHLARKGANAGFTMVKHGSHLRSVLAKSGYRAFGKEALKFGGRVGLRGLGLAAMVYGGAKLYQSLSGSAEEQRQIAHMQDIIENNDIGHANALLRKEYESITDKAEKDNYMKLWLRLALHRRFGLGDVSGVEVGSLYQGNRLITLQEFVSPLQRKSVQQDIEKLLEDITGEKQKLVFHFSQRLIKDTHTLLEEQHSGDKTKADQSMKQLLQEQGESAHTVQRIMDHV